MATNLPPDLLAQILAMYGGTPTTSQNGVDQWFGSGALKDYYLNEQAGGDWQGGDAGSWVADPSRDQRVIRHSTGKGPVDVFDDKGSFIEQDTGSDDALKNLMIIAAMAAGGSALGGAFGGAGAAAGGSGGGMFGALESLGTLGGAEGAAAAAGTLGGGTGSGMWGGLETLGNLSAPGYFTAGGELAGSLANIGAALPEVIGGTGSGMWGALEGLGTLGGAEGLAAAAGLGGAGAGMFGALESLGTLGGKAGLDAAAGLGMGGGGGLLSGLTNALGNGGLMNTLSGLAPIAALIKGPDDPPTITKTATLDPRIDAATFGAGGSAEAMKAWFDKNKATGQNETMVNAQNRLRGLLTSPELYGMQAAQAKSAQGLLGGSVASNPFANWKFPGTGG